jgi:hypothetical protein
VWGDGKKGNGFYQCILYAGMETSHCTLNMYNQYANKRAIGFCLYKRKLESQVNRNGTGGPVFIACK